jgi:hypothetical protein
MRRTFPQPNNYRAFPVANPYRAHPVPYEETPIFVLQGSAKAVQLGQLVYPFRELYVSEEANITAIRYKQDSGSWATVAKGTQPTLIRAVQAVTFTPEEFGGYVFTLEITAGSFVLTRTVDIMAAVAAGQDKVAQKFAALKPFFDTSFAVDSSLISAVEYAVDGGVDTAIPATFGTDLIDRVKNFSISFATAGEKKIELIVTDSSTNESRDHILARISN